MHKHFSVWVAATVAIFTAALFSMSIVGAENSVSWISSSLSLQKEADILTLPSTLNGNIDCYMESSSSCSVSTAYGAVANGSVRLNGTSSPYPVLSYIENKQRFLPVPNSNTAITYTTEPATGLYLYFNYNMASSVTKTFLPGTTQTAYKINRSQDGRLADKANHRLAADYVSMSFSENGRWMVVSQPNVAILRVNLQTFEVLPFASGFNYSIGLSPEPKTAITNDGRYAVVASKNFTRFMLYDLDTCSAVPDTISAPVSCSSRDLKSFISQQVAGYEFINQARFLNNDTLAAYANYKVGTVSKTARFIISTTAISSQIDYLALGDSYISGEGAFNYQAGTDMVDNYCHLSLISYPYLIGHDLNYNSYHSVACSGAVASDITDSSIDYRGQAQNKEVKRFERSPQEIDSIFASFKPGYINQSDFVGRYRPKVAALSVGGNDMGFSKLILSCVPFWETSTCYSTYEDRLELVRKINNQVFPRLVQTYQKVKAAGPPDMRLYVIGYPQIAKPGGNCAINVQLSNDELVFTQQLIAYLDLVIGQAAAKSGVYYVDAQSALNGHRLCEAGPGSVAMNGLTAGNDQPSWLGGPIGAESYHPNDFGHQLLEDTILAATNNLTDPMPAPNLNAAPPAESGLEILNAPKSGRSVKVAQHAPELTSDTVFRQTTTQITLNGTDHALAPSTILQAELHSTPISLGSYTTDSSGNLTAQITIPSGVPAGYHTLHFYGTDITGQSVDIYKTIYVAATADDLDGNGVDDSDQACVGVPASGQDYDQDGIDDACDGIITQPTVQIQSQTSNSRVIASSSSSTATNQPAASSTQLSFSNFSSLSDTQNQVSGRVLSATTESLNSKSQIWPVVSISAFLAVALGVIKFSFSSKT